MLLLSRLRIVALRRARSALVNRFHPKVREERVKALAAFLTATAIALILGALAGPFLNPAQQPSLLARAGLTAIGILSMLAAQLILGLYPRERNGDD